MERCYSKCCGSDWGLSIIDKKYVLVCLRCGKDSGLIIKTIPDMNIKCEECKLDIRSGLKDVDSDDWPRL